MSAAFVHSLEVPWADTDAAQVVWFGNFLRYVEEAEAALLAAIGHARILETYTIGMPRTHVTCSFRSPARYRDRLSVELHVASASDRRIAFAYEIRQTDSGQVVAHGDYRIACVDLPTFGPRPFPADFLLALGAMPGQTNR